MAQQPSIDRVQPAGVRVLRDGKEQCNLLIKAGRDEYERRKRVMWERQGRMCCLYKWIASCPGKLSWAVTTFDHEVPRGHGGGARDDRIEIAIKEKVLRQNGAAHAYCNCQKGSRRIPYNDAYNDAVLEHGSG